MFRFNLDYFSRGLQWTWMQHSQAHVGGIASTRWIFLHGCVAVNRRPSTQNRAEAVRERSI